MTAIRLDDLATLPPEVVDLLDARFDQLVAQAAFELDDSDRYTERHSPHQGVWDGTVAKVDQLLHGHTFVGYHAARLIDEEVAAIVENGMGLASAALVDAKIAHALGAGHLSAAQAQRIRQKALLSEDRGHRLGMIWFVFHPHLLTVPHGIEPLLLTWGGEVIYRAFDEDAEMNKILRNIGQPRIIEAAIEVEALKLFGTPGEKLVKAFLGLHGVEQANDWRFQGRSRAPIHARGIRRVHTLGESEFEELTLFSHWDEGSYVSPAEQPFQGD